MNGETFLAYEDGADTSVNRITAVEYDIAKEIDEKNGWIEPDDEVQVVNTARAADAALALNDLILFCFRDQKLDHTGKGLRTAIRRFIAICWMLKSNLLRDGDDKPLSLAALGRLPQIQCTRCTLSLLAQEFGGQWGFRVRIQKKETTKPNYAKAARSGWKKRRLRQAAKSRLQKP